MRVNQLRKRLQQGQFVFGTFLQEVRSPSIVHILANAGFDFVFLDLEHGSFDQETATDLIQTFRLTPITCLVRVPDQQYHLIARALDAGAEGVMIPRVKNRTQVEEIVHIVRFPPLGERGMGGIMGHSDYQKIETSSFLQNANQENLIIIQIENAEAVENIDELLSVPDVDIALIGPQDLSVSLGVPLDFKHPKMEEAIQRVVDSGLRNHVVIGIHGGDLQALSYWGRKGVRVLSSSSDRLMLVNASENIVQSLRSSVI